MYRKNTIIATSVAILMLLSSCTNMSAMNNDISQVDESIYVGEKDIDNIQVDEVINNACNKIIELNNYCEIKDIEFLGDNLYILSKNQDDSVNLEQYNLVTQKTKNIEVVIKENTMLQLNIKNDYILINNVELEWKKGTLAVYDTELNYIDVYEDIYPSCAYNEESIYYYDIENNSLVTIKDNKKEYMREYNKEKIDDCLITNVENLTYLNNKLYMNVSYIQNGKESSENGYVCIDLINNEDNLQLDIKKYKY